MTGRLTETGRCYGMKINVIKISRQTFPNIPITDRDRPKTAENVEYFNYLGSMIANGARYTCEVKCSIFMIR
jgi:hypothetical protein